MENESNTSTQSEENFKIVSSANYSKSRSPLGNVQDFLMERERFANHYLQLENNMTNLQREHIKLQIDYCNNQIKKLLNL